MIDQETTQEMAGPSDVVEPALASEPVPPTATPPVIPAKSARRRIWPYVLSALLLVIASSGITYLAVTDSTPDNSVTTGTTGEDSATSRREPCRRDPGR